jgi:uncharacterized protein CbrC (UPF0167 family)
MAETFADLGIPFPLFEAPAKEASEYKGLGRCKLCGTGQAHCFEADEIVGRRPRRLLCCYACLRAGRAARAKDTVLGLVTWEGAAEGLTHGVPGLESSDFELIPSDDDPEWLRARVPSVMLVELLRTPGCVTWQGEQWQFCCGRPSVYLGEWKEEEFERRAPDGDGRTLFLQTAIEGLGDAWGKLRCLGGPYVYRRPACQRLLGHYDMD